MPEQTSPFVCKHFTRIHGRVAKRILLDLPDWQFNQIANDVNHETELFAWFEQKALADTQRLFEDSNYYDNDRNTFKFEKDS